jgi:hypothetical protein
MALRRKPRYGIQRDEAKVFWEKYIGGPSARAKYKENS